MVEAFKLWNEPNNLSHWNFQIDPQWQQFCQMIKQAAAALKQEFPHLPLVLGGLSPIDPCFVDLLQDQGALENMNAVAIHGFPLDWNDWKIDEWPRKIEAIQSRIRLPVWVTEVGASSFGADEVQEFGLRRTQDLLLNRVDRVYWYSLLDLPPAWKATTRHHESEGSSYYRHFYLGLIRADFTLKPAFHCFDSRMGICQWFAFEDPRLDMAVQYLHELGVRRLRTGISWADWHRPNAIQWFDRQMQALQDFDVTVTLCFTPPSRGIHPCHTSPPIHAEEFSWFALEVARRYAASTPGIPCGGTNN